jgi:hypothetical protein
MPRSESEIMNEQYPFDSSGGIAFSSAARTASSNSADLTRPTGARGVRVWIVETAHASSPSVVFTITAKDPASGAYSTLLASVAVTGEGTTTLTIYPTLTGSANVIAQMAMPKTWRIEAAHGNANSITYSVGFSYLY